MDWDKSVQRNCYQPRTDQEFTGGVLKTWPWRITEGHMSSKRFKSLKTRETRKLFVGVHGKMEEVQKRVGRL